MNKSVGILIVFIASVCSAYFIYYFYDRREDQVATRTVAEVITDLDYRFRNSVNASFSSIGVEFPPKEIALLAVKDEKVLELWAKGNQSWKKVKTIVITAASGKSGPKLREGDRQVPEGIYKIIGLNPNSSYHLSMKLNYPNEFDSYWANKEGRTSPGSDIFIHGKAVSIGCIAIGDDAIEELFYIVHRVGIEKVKVVIAPRDPRKHDIVRETDFPVWVDALYKSVKSEFLSISST